MYYLQPVQTNYGDVLHAPAPTYSGSMKEGGGGGGRWYEQNTPHGFVGAPLPRLTSCVTWRGLMWVSEGRDVMKAA